MKDNITLKRAGVDFFDFFYGVKSEVSNVYWSGHLKKPDYDNLFKWYRIQLDSEKRIIFQILNKQVEVGYLYFDLCAEKMIELSYAVSEEYWGKGIATSAIKAAVLFAKEKYSDFVVKAYIAVENYGSIKALTRNGFRKTGCEYKKSLGGRTIVMEEYICYPKSVFIIAEAGVNHNGDINLAKKLIDVAIDSGVDAVKFQTWKTELIATKEVKQATYQTENTGQEESQFDMLKRLELSYNEFRELKQYCDDKGILFLSTADEEESADFLFDIQDVFKIGSGEVTNYPYLYHIGSFKKKVILSTGMATLKEVGDAVSVLISAGTKRENIIVLHANTQYPSPLEDINLRAMQTMAAEFDVEFGYSDHTLGSQVAVMAVAMGATVIEKHFTLDKTMDGPDHKASLSPEELNEFVHDIRQAELILGSNEKKPSASEGSNIAIVRKAIVAKCSIKKGEELSVDNLAVKRAGNGINPMRWNEIVGTTALRDYQADELI